MFCIPYLIPNYTDIKFINQILKHRYFMFTKFNKEIIEFLYLNILYTMFNIHT